MRRRSFIIALLLLLLIGVGGVAFYLHLRGDASPEFAEADRAFHRLPASSGWVLEKTRTQAHMEPKLWWLKKIGIDYKTKIEIHHYDFAGPQPMGGISVQVVHTEQKIYHFMLKGKYREKEDFKKHLFHGSPRLQPLLHP